MKNPSDLSKDQLADLVAQIQGILWLDLGGEGAPSKNAEWWNPDKGWDADTVEAIAEQLAKAGLRPAKKGEKEDEERGGGKPGFDARAEQERLLLLARDKGTESTPALDDLVDEAASRLASDTNNAGTGAQLEFLLERLGPGCVRDIEAALAGESQGKG
jgi:hypothetical protein